jgi:CBS domain-containing protein
MRTSDLAATPVADLMSSRVVSVPASCQLMKAMDTILGTGLRHLVVVGATGRCRGIVSAETVATRLMIHAAAPREPIGDLVPDVFTAIARHASVVDAAGLMLSGGVDALCVVDEYRRPVGVVTWSDLLRSVTTRERVRRARQQVGA